MLDILDSQFEFFSHSSSLVIQLFGKELSLFSLYFFHFPTYPNHKCAFQMLHLPILVVFSNLVLTLAFNPRRTNYNEQTARMLLHMSSAAYGNQQQACLDK